MIGVGLRLTQAAARGGGQAFPSDGTPTLVIQIGGSNQTPPRADPLFPSITTNFQKWVR